MSTKPTPQANHTPKTPQPTNQAISTLDDTITVSAWDLQNTQDTLDGIITAFDEIATVLYLIGRGDLLPHQIKALTSLAISHAQTWAEVAQMLGGNHD